MLKNILYFIYFTTIFSVNAQNEWADPPYNLTQEAIEGNVKLEGKTLTIPEDLISDTPVLNLFYNKSKNKLVYQLTQTEIGSQ